jgi:hypothetical protein
MEATRDASSKSEKKVFTLEHVEELALEIIAVC